MFGSRFECSLLIAACLFIGLEFVQADDPSTPVNQVSLAWDPNPEPDISGYRLHYGTVSGSYPETLDVGNTTTSPLILPAPGTYYAVVTAYNTAGLESLPSNEVVFSVPIDTTQPVISGLPADIAVAPDSLGGATAVVSWVEPTASDDVGVVSLVSSHESGDTFPAGATIVTYTAEDAAGNIATASFTVTVSSIEIWRLSAFGSEAFDPQVSGDTANPDGDRWDNLAEYALGLNPLDMDGDSVTSLMLSADQVQFQLSHIPLLPDVVLSVESFAPPAGEWFQLATLSPAGGWTLNASNVQVASEPVGELTRVTVTRSIQGKEGEFFRLTMVKQAQP